MINFFYQNLVIFLVLILTSPLQQDIFLVLILPLPQDIRGI